MPIPSGYTSGQVVQAVPSLSATEWATFTPTWTNLTVGNAVQDFRYMTINKFICVVGVITLGSTSSVASAPVFTLPQTSVTYASQNERLGMGILEDTGTDGYDCWVLYGTTTTARLRVPLASGTYINSTAINSTTPFTWVSGDRISVNFIYQAA